MSEPKEEGVFQPYVPDETDLPEMTMVVLILGTIQALFFGMADAYLALKVGMTVGASIPAAVISMSILRGVLKRSSILENNLVQNMASVGESLACGAAFTIPSLYLLQAFLLKSGQSVPYTLDPINIYFMACMGGLMGILFMIPLRRYLIVKEHGRLRYPEGTACAEVLMAGDKGGRSAITVFTGILVAGGYRACMSVLGLFKEAVSWPVTALYTKVSLDLLPSLLAVGYILGIETCGIMMAGATLGWFVIIPLIAYFGHDLTIIIPPGEIPIGQMTPDDIWASYLRYIGAGGVAFGGIISLLKAMPTIVESIGSAVKELLKKDNAPAQARTSRDIPLPLVLGGWLLIFFIIGLNTGINLSGFLGALLTVVFAFFFVTVSSRIVGLVGTTSMPLSGMTIGALLVTCVVVKAAGFTGGAGMAAALVVAAMICIAISMGGDISQDLKIGYLVGATPRWVQVTQIVGVLFSSAVVCFIIKLLSPAVMSGELKAPQANLLFLITKGVLEGNLPWIPVIIGMAIAACVEMMGIGSLPFAVGLYLTFDLSATVVFGGLIHWGVNQFFSPTLRKGIYEHGLLLCSGFVAGDALVGVGVAVLAGYQVDKLVSGHFAHLWFTQSDGFATFLFALLCVFLTWQVYAQGRLLQREEPRPPE